MPCRVPAAETGCLDVRASLALCWHQPVAGGKVRPASCARIAIPFAFAPLLRTYVSEQPDIGGFISCWKLFQEFQEKSVVWGPVG